LGKSAEMKIELNAYLVALSIILLATLEAASGQDSKCFEVRKKKDKSYNGKLLLNSDTDLTPKKIEVTFDKPFNSVTLFKGRDMSCSGLTCTFDVSSWGKKIRAGKTKKLGMRVRFDESEPLPEVTSIKVDGKETCKYEPEGTTTTAETTTPSESTTPAETTLPVEETSEPSETTTPDEETTEPSESTTPSEETTEPSESTTPSEETTEPSESTTPSEETTEPSESTTSGEETTEPSESTTPGEETTEPTESTTPAETTTPATTTTTTAAPAPNNNGGWGGWSWWNWFG